MKLTRLTWWLPDPTLGTFSLFGSIKSAFHKVENVVKNVATTITHPSVKSVEAFITNPLGAQANAAITGPSGVNPKTTAWLTAAGAGTIYGGSLLLGPNLGIVPAAAGTFGAVAGSAGGGTVTGAVSGATIGDTFITPAAGNLVNTGITDPLSFLTSLGKGFFTGSNPAIAGSGTTASAALPDNGPATSTGIGWLLGIGAVILVIVMLFRGR
ncbi:MAG: hypothetical protein KGJ13_06370 [Patescibacteria group bacterium]|nr:hypothetical protein [Patescibacteria group bacterium]